jgi:hypothetical protein
MKAGAANGFAAKKTGPPKQQINKKAKIMNYLARFDESMAIGYLKAANTTDSDVLHSRHQNLVSSLEIGRKFAFVPMALGGIWTAVGIPALIFFIGFLLIPLGIALIYGSIWCRKRLAVNIAVANSAYAKHMSALGAKTPHAAPPAPTVFRPDTNVALAQRQ